MQQDNTLARLAGDAPASCNPLRGAERGLPDSFANILQSTYSDGMEPDEPVRIPITDTFDLHTIHPREVAAVVEAYLEEADSLGLKTVRIIHGRGIGVQRAIVRAVLARSPQVRSYHDAPPEAGGWGATIAILR